MANRDENLDVPENDRSSDAGGEQKEVRMKVLPERLLEVFGKDKELALKAEMPEDEFLDAMKKLQERPASLVLQDERVAEEFSDIMKKKMEKAEGEMPTNEMLDEAVAELAAKLQGDKKMMAALEDQYGVKKIDKTMIREMQAMVVSEADLQRREYEALAAQTEIEAREKGGEKSRGDEPSSDRSAVGGYEYSEADAGGYVSPNAPAGGAMKVPPRRGGSVAAKK